MGDFLLSIRLDALREGDGAWKKIHVQEKDNNFLGLEGPGC
jgi:hypothetical protein